MTLTVNQNRDCIACDSADLSDKGLDAGVSRMACGVNWDVSRPVSNIVVRQPVQKDDH